ncbi:MAG TPA: hypothetical protein VN722_08460 [Hanamia sp.]|nr:hypothetical protein [Hanamia sp.]
MAGIKQPIQDILTKLTAISVTNADLQSVGLFARIWNNQLKNIRDGKDYTWPRPAAFVEVVSPAIYEIIGLGFRSSDLGIRIHLIHDFYNQDGTLEQDLSIFDIRDTVLLNLSQYCPTACGPLNCVNEEQDYDHDNLYHYILEFSTNFTDSKGSPFDPALNNYDETANPNLDASIVDGGVPVPVPDPNPEFIIPTQNY